MVNTLPVRGAKKNPGIDLRYVRSVCVLNGTSFAEWCRRHGYSVAFAHMSATGKKHGPAAHRIVRELKEEFAL